jgi:hypothetical protein
MFIDATDVRSPSVRRAHVNLEHLAFTVDMALLTEGGIVSPGVYKHLPPDGGEYPNSRDKLKFVEHRSFVRTSGR